MTALAAGVPVTVALAESQSITLTTTQGATGSVAMTSTIPGITGTLSNFKFGPGAFNKILGPYSAPVSAVLTLERGLGSADYVINAGLEPGIIISSSAPNDGDLRPNGTIYIQTI